MLYTYRPLLPYTSIPKYLNTEGGKTTKHNKIRLRVEVDDRVRMLVIMMQASCVLYFAKPHGHKPKGCSPQSSPDVTVGLD